MQTPHSNADLFLTAFNQIERHLRSAFNATGHIGFKRLVDALGQRNSLVALYKQDLIEFLELRNAIVHHSTGMPIAQPSDEAVARIQELELKLTNPPLALEIASKPVFTCTTDDDIVEIVRVMNEKHFALIPVYDKGQFAGVFSESSLTKWLAHIATVEGFVIKEQRIGELADFFDHSDNKHNAFRFVAKETNAYAVRDDFIEYMADHKRLSAVFVTEHGYPTEPIVGIITAWDIHKLSRYQHAA